MIPKLNLICAKADLKTYSEYIKWDGEVFCATDAYRMIIWKPSDNHGLPNQPVYIHMDEWKKLTKKQKGTPVLSFKDVVEFGEHSCDYKLQSDMDKEYGLTFDKNHPLVQRGVEKEGTKPFVYPNWKVVWPNVTGIKDPVIEDYFRYGTEATDIQQIGINAVYLSDLQKAMDGSYTKITFYGKTKAMLVECPDTPFTINESIIGLLMPVRIP